MLTSKPSKVGKVVICGMKGVGKTAILEQLIYGNVTPDTVRLKTMSTPSYIVNTNFGFPFQEFHPTIEDTYVASVDTGRGSRDILRIFDTAGLQGNVQVSQRSCTSYHRLSLQHFRSQLPRHYLQFPDAFVLVYDPCDPASLDMLAGIKNDVDKNKDKKEVN